VSETRTDAPASTARVVEASGNTVEEAVATALAELGVAREAVEHGRELAHEPAPAAAGGTRAREDRGR